MSQRLYVMHTPVSTSTALCKGMFKSNKLGAQPLFVPNSASCFHIMATIIDVLANGGDG